MNAKVIIQDIKSYADPLRAVQLQRYFKTGKGEYGEGDKFIGLTVPQTRKLAKTYQKIDLETISELLSSPLHEVRLFSLMILVEKFRKAEKKDKGKILKFYLRHREGINNWDLVDLSAPYILGAYAFETRNTKEMEKLIKASSLWDRRIGMLATFPFIKNSELDIVYKFAFKLMQDEEDLMQKAVGWMLREAGKKDPKRLLNFINQYAHQMPRTMLRYAIEKFPLDKRKAILKVRQS